MFVLKLFAEHTSASAGRAEKYWIFRAATSNYFHYWLICQLLFPSHHEPTVQNTKLIQFTIK